jgi:hypothetical protein
VVRDVTFETWIRNGEIPGIYFIAVSCVDKIYNKVVDKITFILKNQNYITESFSYGLYTVRARLQEGRVTLALEITLLFLVSQGERKQKTWP